VLVDKANGMSKGSGATHCPQPVFMLHSIGVVSVITFVATGFVFVSGKASAEAMIEGLHNKVMLLLLLLLFLLMMVMMMMMTMTMNQQQQEQSHHH